MQSRPHNPTMSEQYTYTRVAINLQYPHTDLRDEKNLPPSYRDNTTRMMPDTSSGIALGVARSGATHKHRLTLVLLHGFTGSAQSWEDVLPDLTLPGLQIMAIDMLGHGNSDSPVDPQRYAIEYCQTDIISVLRAYAVEPGEAILLGYSMGGRIALYSAFSGYFRGLILESASPGLADARERAQRRQSDMVLAERIKREGVASFVDYWEQLPLFASQRDLPAEKRAAQHAQRLNNQAIGLANSLLGVGTGVQPALHARLPTLTLPVLLIAGELDTKFCGIAHYMAEDLPQSQLHIVPGAGHTVHLEQPAAFAQLVREFCQMML